MLSDVDPIFLWPVKFCVATTITSYLLSVVTGNVSQVDRVWTFLPTIYTAYYALLPLWPDEPPTFLFPSAPRTINPSVVKDFSPRALLMLALVVTWMTRLSYNTWRRGLFNLHDEDYRWAVLRQKIPPWLFQVFNLCFVAIAQNIILLLLGVPTKMAVAQPHEPLSDSDYILGALGFVTIAIEFVADNQQYSYQTFKHSGEINPNEWPGARLAWTAADAKRGFVTRGLWAWSRHPNFLCEQSFWVIINLFPVLAPSSPKLTVSRDGVTTFVTLAPCLVLCMLFYSSTIFTESISRSKYPAAYSAYQQRVGMFVPFVTPVMGVLLMVVGKREKIERLVYGDVEKAE